MSGSGDHPKENVSYDTIDDEDEFEWKKMDEETDRDARALLGLSKGDPIDPDALDILFEKLENDTKNLQARTRRIKDCLYFLCGIIMGLVGGLVVKYYSPTTPTKNSPDEADNVTEAQIEV